MACIRSLCSTLVGRPVEGPPRCTLMTINGSSAMHAYPRASILRDRPGPELPVTAMCPE